MPEIGVVQNSICFICGFFQIFNDFFSATTVFRELSFSIRCAFKNFTHTECFICHKPFSLHASAKKVPKFPNFFFPHTRTFQISIMLRKTFTTDAHILRRRTYCMISIFSAWLLWPILPQKMATDPQYLLLHGGKKHFAHIAISSIFRLLVCGKIAQFLKNLH